MKLYTEEELLKAIQLGRNYGGWVTTEPEILKQLIPIELPNDDEIENKGKWVFNNDGHTISTHYNTVPSWVNGAKWMKKQILNQNK